MAINVLILGDGIGGIATASLLLKKARKKSFDLRIRLVGSQMSMRGKQKHFLNAG